MGRLRAAPHRGGRANQLQQDRSPCHRARLLSTGLHERDSRALNTELLGTQRLQESGTCLVGTLAGKKGILEKAVSGGHCFDLLCDLGEVTNFSESQFLIRKMGMTGGIKDSTHEGGLVL